MSQPGPRPPAPRRAKTTAPPPRKGRSARGRRRNSRWTKLGVLLVSVAVVAGIVALVVANAGGSSSSSSTSPPALASLDTAATGATVDGIQCQSTEQVVYHIHSHLAVYVNGSARTIPAGIGVAPPRDVVQTSTGPFVDAGSCFYWLHSHTADGIIHVESPTQQTYTLGNYFDIWGQPLSTTQVGPAHGTVTAYVNGQVYNGNPRDITLGAHTLIQLDVGGNVAPQPFTFPAGL
jgi:hypothetical protein